MKKLLALILVGVMVFCVSACTTKPVEESTQATADNTVQDTGQNTGSQPNAPAPLSIDDMYLYDSNGQRTDITSIGYLLDTEHATYRGVKPGDPVSILAEKYILEELRVLKLSEEYNPQIATRENILWDDDLDISGRLDIEGFSYFLSFTISDGIVFSISVHAISD